MKTTTLTRQQLYDRVWSKPVDQLAKEFGISNVGLGKACRRHGIPVPPRGYWAKKAAGHRLRQVPLPAAAQPWQERITFHGSSRPESQEPDAIEVHPLVAFEQAPEHQLVVVPYVEVPSVPKGKVGFGVAIEFEDSEHAKQLRSDFIVAFRDLVTLFLASFWFKWVGPSANRYPPRPLGSERSNPHPRRH